jgi:Strictosidine synthase
VSVLGDFVKEVFFRDRDRHAIPVLDGPMRANERLDEGVVLNDALVEPDDVAICDDGCAWVTSKDAVYRFESSRFDDAPRKIDLGGPATAMTRRPGGGIAVAVAGRGVVFVAKDASTMPLTLSGAAPLGCPTALAFGPDNVLFACDGSMENPPDRWVYDLMRRGASGRLLRIDLSTGAATTLVDQMKWPNGLCIAQDDQSLIIAEAWSHSLLKLPFKGPPGKVQRIAGNLPGYPARILRYKTGYAMAYFALRTQLVDFVLTEDAYRQKMVERIEPEFWIAPSLRSEGHYLEPVQGGGLKKHGSLNAWAPARMASSSCSTKSSNP